MQQALGSRATVPAPLRAQARGTAAARGVPLLVQCSKKVTKKAQVVLVQDVPNLGSSGALTSVRLGYFRCALLPVPAATLRRLVALRRDSAAAQTSPPAAHACTRLHTPARPCQAEPRCGAVASCRNYLLPEGLAKLADESILASIKSKREAEEAAARKVCARGQRLRPHPSC
jgi:hypothetical protein